MKIAFDHQMFTMQKYGGISRYFAKLAKHLLRLEQEPAVFVPFYQNNYLDELPAAVVKGRKLRILPSRSIQFFLTVNHYLAKRSITRWMPDVIHETYYSSRPGPSKKIPIVVTVYDMIHELFPDMYSPRDQTSKLKRASVNRAAYIICISNSTKRDLIRLFNVPKEKISVVHLGVDHCKKDSRRDTSLFKQVCNKPYILHVGSRHGYNNFVTFLKAFASSPRLMSDFQIVNFGRSDITIREMLRIRKLGFDTKQIVHVSGSDEILINCYRHASALVCPSLYEGFGLPTLEAMAYGCPVICSNTSSLPEVVGDAAEMFDPASIDDMRYAIENVVYSTERADQLKDSGYSRIKMFSWNKCASETLKVYRSLLSV